MSTKLPLWLRFFLLVGIVAFAAGAGLLAYRYYTRPVTLTRGGRFYRRRGCQGNVGDRKRARFDERPDAAKGH